MEKRAKRRRGCDLAERPNAGEIRDATGGLWKGTRGTKESKQGGGGANEAERGKGESC